MRKIFITGAGGQIGVELVRYLREIYGAENVMATDLRKSADDGGGPFAALDVRNREKVGDLVGLFKPDTIMHMAGILSAMGESKPSLLWEVNMNGLHNILEVARYEGCAVFFPSSIAAFGVGTPLNSTPQDTIQRPDTLYGVTKVSGELLCDYYHRRYGIDTRGLRFPGLISHTVKPSGGTSDYSTHIYYDAKSEGKYTCYLKAGTFMDMMYMPDALSSIVRLMEADSSKLKHRNAFNISAMSVDPEMMAASIRKHIPNFSISYEIDPIRQDIADSWPNSLDCSAAELEWGFAPQYNLDAMTADMLSKIDVEKS